MPARPQATRETVVHLKISGCLSWRQIAKQTGIKERTARRWYQQWIDEGRLEAKTSTGRPRTVRTPRNIQRIARTTKNQKRKSIRKVAKHLNDAGSPSTVYRALRFDLGYKPV
jgi:YD repeat-containing protein